MLTDMKKSSVLIAIALALSLALTGCNSKEKQLQGKWKIDMSKLPASMTSGPGAAAAQQTLSGISVEFKSDNTYSAAIGPMTQQGTWKLDASTVTITPTSGAGDKSPGSATLSDDGKSLAWAIPGQGQSITLVKDAS